MPVAYKIAIAAAFLAGLSFGASDCSSAYAQAKREKPAAEPSGAGAAQQIVALTNRERTQRGLPALKVDRHCTLAITGHVSDMARGRFLSHEGSDGRGAGARYRQHSPAGRGAGENVAYNSAGTPQSFMRQWMNSSDHRSNILNAKYKGIGAAVRANCASSGARGKCTYYAGQCFSL